MVLQLSKQQDLAVQAEGHSLILGAAGTGKTTVLCEKIRTLLEKGAEAKDITVVLFTYKACLHIQVALLESLGEVAEHITVVTLRDLCLETLQDQELEGTVADGQDMRRILRYAMKAVEFSGSVKEAEHIVRKFYGQVQNPQENARYADLFQSYQGFMKQYALIDRFELVRQSLALIEEDKTALTPYKHILVPHIHEATPVQLLWLMAHQEAAELTFFADDNQHLFVHDGAIGAGIVRMMTEDYHFKLFQLETNFVQEQNIGQAAENFVAGAKGYVRKSISFSRKGKGALQVRHYECYADELAALTSLVHEIFSGDEKQKVAILTRHDREAQRLERVFMAKGYADLMASRATPVWEYPGAVLVLDILDLLFDRAKPQQLMNVLTSMGVSHSLAQILFREGLVSDKWLAEGAPIPKGLDIPKNAFSELQAVRAKLTRPYEVLKKQLLPPRDVFKSIMFDVMQTLGEEAQRDVLIATEYVLAFESHVRDLPDLARKTHSDFRKDRSLVIAPVHASRGLMCDVVIIPFVNEGQFPFTGYTALPKDTHHDRRLMYQALTRSQHKIILTSHGTASPFVDELKALFAQTSQ